MCWPSFLEGYYQLIKELYLKQKEKVIFGFFLVPVLASQSSDLRKRPRKRLDNKENQNVTWRNTVFFEFNKYYYYYCHHYQQFLLRLLRNNFYYNVKPINAILLIMNNQTKFNAYVNLFNETNKVLSCKNSLSALQLSIPSSANSINHSVVI